MPIDKLTTEPVSRAGENRDTTGLTNQPEAVVSGNKVKATSRAVTDVGQMKAIGTSLMRANSDRNKLNARLMAKYNAEKPYEQAELDAEGLGWKANFTTKPLATLVDRVAPRFRMAVESLKFLTDASLPEDWPGASSKNDYFRRCVTETIRSRRGWKNLLDELAQENALFGYTITACLDDVSWFPRNFRQDQAYLSRGTRQNVEECSVLWIKETYQLHEFFSKWGTDLDAAKDAGWDTAECLETLNKSMPTDKVSKNSENDRVYEDLRRECSLSSNYMDGARAIVVYHLLVVELDGQISHYMVDEKMEKQLFGRYDRYPDMKSCASFFSFQLGNGTMHGSKGIGREIYNMASVVDRVRNETADRLILSGKVIVQGDGKLLKRFRAKLHGNAILIDSAYTISQQRIDGNVEPFFMLDNYFRDLLDQMAGSASPKILKGERVTKAAVDLYAEREEEGRDSVMGRFLTQFADMIGTMTQRLLSSEVGAVDKDAAALMKKLLTKLTAEEIQLLAKKPCIQTVSDYTETERQQIVVLASEARGNPLYNQREIEFRKISALVGEDFAAAVLLPQNDPTEEAEQTRQQNFELLLMRTGQEVGVSVRDSHNIHMQIVFDDIEKVLLPAVADQSDLTALPIARIELDHVKAHLQVAIQFAASGQYDAQMQKVAEMEQLLTQMEQQVQQQHAALDEQTQAAMDTGMVTPDQLTAPPVPPEGAAPGMV